MLATAGGKALLYLKEHKMGGTAFHLAASFGHVAAVSLLIEMGGNDLILEPAYNGELAWDAAMHDGHVGIRGLLLEAIGVSETLSEKWLNH